MKKPVLISALIGLSLFACQKEKNAVPETPAPQINALNMDVNQNFSYLAADNSRANMTFQNKGNDHTMTIKANNIKFVLDKKDADADSEIYERNGVEAKLTKDSLIITQGEKVIPLVRLK